MSCHYINYFLMLAIVGFFFFWIRKWWEICLKYHDPYSIRGIANEFLAFFCIYGNKHIKVLYLLALLAP